MFAPLLYRIRKARRHGRLASALVLFGAMAVLELGSGAAHEIHDDWLLPIYSVVRASPSRLALGDWDGDGLSDEQEAAYARSFAPAVILDRDDRARPASVSWVLGRADFVSGESGAAGHAIDPETRQGSSRPDDWVTYVDVYPRVDGDIQIEYWFYYPYNDGPLFFKHESDWEHITVRLDAAGRPRGAYLARHEDNRPGPYFTWSRLRKQGDHPVVLSARGTHATYADAADLPFFESAGSCQDIEACAEPVWRTWEGGGLFRLDELGRRTRAAAALRFPGHWGATGFLPGTSAPRGPMFQAGHCVGGFASCNKDIALAGATESGAEGG